MTSDETCCVICHSKICYKKGYKVRVLTNDKQEIFLDLCAVCYKAIASDETRKYWREKQAECRKNKKKVNNPDCHNNVKIQEGEKK